MDSIQKCAAAIKSEIDSMLEDTHTDADASQNLFDNELVTLKEEINLPTENTDDKKLEDDRACQDLLVEKQSSDLVLENYLNSNIKTENELVSYDYPNFDEGDVYSEEEATNNQDKVCENIKMEIEEDIQQAPCQNVGSLDGNDCNEIVPDIVDKGAKYSFVTKIPLEVMNEIDSLTPDCLLETTSTQETVISGNETPSIVPKTTIDSFNTTQNTLLDEYASVNASYEEFQLNSITGDELTLTQQVYAEIKKKEQLCPKCPKVCKTKHSLKLHLKAHQTIENYNNGRKKGQITRMLNAQKKQKSNHVYPDIQQADITGSTVCKTEREVQIQEAYKCTCGKAFKRRTRMETCLRSHESGESDQNQYKCSSCPKQFKSREELSLHRKRLHRKKFPCKFCPTSYHSQRKLIKHLQIHQKVQMTEYKVIEGLVKGKTKLQCFMCSKSCQEISELKTHVITKHKDGPYSCPHCKNSFPSMIDFGNHMKTYHPKVEEQSVLDVLEAFSRLIQEWKCEECNVQFLEADKLALHQIEEHSHEQKTDAQFQCPDCQRVFVSQKGLTSHRRIHEVEVLEKPKTEELGLLCLECRMVCEDMAALTSHMRYHSLDRKYVCKFCDYRFATLEKRRAHVEIHTSAGDMKFVCFICEYQCTSLNRLNKHKQSLKHANMKEYLLTGKPLIEESTSTENKKEAKTSAKKRKKSQENCKSDKDICHSDSSEADSAVCCDVCGESFPSESEMLEHKQTHPFIEFPNEDTPTRIFFK